MTPACAIDETSFRAHPKIHALLQGARSRHLTKAELKTYVEALPAEKARAKAALAVASIESATVQRIAQEMVHLYDFEKHHGLSPEKCARDIGFVSVYATQAMLANDPDWYANAFLYWMRTMVQAFEFASTTVGTEAANRYPKLTEEASELPKGIRAINDTYRRLTLDYQNGLDEQSWTYMEPYLEQTVVVLSSTAGQ